MTENGGGTGASEVFGDTCVLFDYAVEGREAAQKLFEDRSDVEKIASKRIKREFESVADRQQDIHRELLEVATSAELEEYDPDAVGGQSNDLTYTIDLYADLLALKDTVEVVRRLNELINRLNKAKEELFGQGGLVMVIDIDGLDAQLKGLLAGVVDNDADVRVLCDAVAWRRDGGSGIFLSEDTEDILGKGHEETDGSSADDKSPPDTDNHGLPDSFESLLSGDEPKSLPERINDQIALRYDRRATLKIMSVSVFLEMEAAHADRVSTESA